MIRCRIGSRPPAPCWDDLCHSGDQTICGIWGEELEAALDEEWAEEYPHDDRDEEVAS